MNDPTKREAIHDPQDLERVLVSRQHAGDVHGMAALYESDAVLDCGKGRLVRGRGAILSFFIEYNATGRKFAIGAQSPALVCGDLALTSTCLPDGDITTEVARRQRDGTWLWVIDRYSVTCTMGT